ncbi:hypothetical protein [Streptomyces sp. NPDC059271]|uniref:hypothetical protein n=1 Tax=Streptomyces sp. NPDC059271 TaxID=3346799 RepID=UPI0036C6F82F
MTKSGNDHHKRQARRLRADNPRCRFPDLLAALSSRPARRPSTDLVLLCSGLAHPLDGGRCAREAGHELLDGDRSWCSPKPNLPVHVWRGYYAAADEDLQAQREARLAAMSPAERAAWVAEAEAEYWAEIADDAREPYDPREDKYQEMGRDALGEERWADEPDGHEHSGARTSWEGE